MTPCLQPGCGVLVVKGRCTKHTRSVDRMYKARSPASRAVYKSPRWQGTRRTVLRANPWCAVPGCGQMATDVDHIVPVEDGGDPFDLANLQGLCKKHHSSKTASETFRRT